MLLDTLRDELLRVAEDVVASVSALEHFAALLVNDLPLLVHHVVVLDHVLASVEVHAFDFLLSACDRARHPWVLDGLDLEAVHQPPDAIGRRAENLHEVVFQRDEEAARPRVALPPSTAAQLVVDAPALVPLGADDVQTTDLCYALAEDDVGASSGHV